MESDWLGLLDHDRVQSLALLEHAVPAFEVASLARLSFDCGKDRLLAARIQ